MNLFTLLITQSLALAALTLSLSQFTQAATVEIQETAFEMNGTKIWYPPVILAKKGDTVKIHAVSKIGGKNNVHGFAIDQFKVQSLVDEKGTDIEFIADKAGIFPIRCHLHPAHIGGQLLVE